jgi:hypothetical protein
MIEGTSTWRSAKWGGSGFKALHGSAAMSYDFTHQYRQLLRTYDNDAQRSVSRH